MERWPALGSASRLSRGGPGRPTRARSAVSDRQRDDPDQEEAAGQAVEYADGEGAYALFVDTDVS
jgi:hypothetical protein